MNTIYTFEIDVKDQSFLRNVKYLAVLVYLDSELNWIWSATPIDERCLVTKEFRSECVFNTYEAALRDGVNAGFEEIAKIHKIRLQ